MIYLELFWGFLIVGCFSFGGAYGAIPLIREVVMMHGWADEELLAFSKVHKKRHKKPLSPIALIVMSAVLGIILC